MKREQFQITSTTGHNVIKFKWNSSIREIERLVGEIANSEKAVYRLTDSESIRGGLYNDYQAGSREWTRNDGIKVTFTVIMLS